MVCHCLHAQEAALAGKAGTVIKNLFLKVGSWSYCDISCSICAARRRATEAAQAEIRREAAAARQHLAWRA